MAQIEWDASGQRLFEYGLDRGVLYPPDEVGVPWNGLLSVETGSGSFDSTPIFFNGIKTFDFVTPGEFEGKIKAITYPHEFYQFEGVAEQAPGVFIAHQQAKTFGLSYRTLIGNDAVGNGYGYKIHVLYNLTAEPESVSYETISDSVEPANFQWKIAGVPEWLSGRRPTVHFTFDSTKIDEVALGIIQDTLYGTPSTPPHLPSVVELLSSFTITITDNGDGTWTAEGPDHLLTVAGPNFTIEDANAVFLDANTYRVAST